MKSNKFILISAIIITIVISFITIGYSDSTINLSIRDILATVRIEKDIRVTNIKVLNSTNSAISNYEEYNYNNVSMGINLPNETSTITYSIDITNIGNVEMGILSIEGLPSNLEYTLDNYDLQEKLCINTNQCSLGITKNINITIKYTNGGYDSTKTDYDIVLKFAFRSYHKVYYRNITNNNYPTEVIDGGNLSITFTGDVPGEINLDQPINYTYNSPQLTINNIESDVTITGIKIDDNYAIVAPEDATNVTIDNKEITPDNPININDILTKEYNGVNLTNKVISSIDIEVAYESGTGSKQSLNCILVVNGTEYTQTISIPGKTTASTTVSFTNLNISPDSTFIVKYQQDKITNGSISISSTKMTVNLT